MFSPIHLRDGLSRGLIRHTKFSLVSVIPVAGVLVISGLLPPATARADQSLGRQAPRYAIVAEEKTVEQSPWKAVIETLEKEHAAKLFYWDDGNSGKLRERLAAMRPQYVCFVARPDELARPAAVRVQPRDGHSLTLPLLGAYYRNAGMLMRSLDDDPYDDAIWAVLTGATAKDALGVVAAKPLTVRSGLSHVGSGWLQWLERGISFSEGKKGQKWTKMPGSAPKETEGPDDTTKQFIAALNSDKVDMVSTSGHATEHDWQMGYSYRSGQIVTPGKIQKLPEAARESYKKLLKTEASGPERGIARLLGVDTSNKVYPIRTDNPKVYYSPGNCLIARVDGRDCMALGWIHHGARQLFGHAGLQTRSCYAWGVAEYFLALQGRFSFAESVWLNQQALRWQLDQMSEEDKKGKYLCCRNETCLPAGRAFVWETTVLYGDPLWQARVKPVAEPLYDQQMHSRDLGDGRTELTFTVKMRRAQLPSRPAAFLLETPAGSQVAVKEGPKNLVVADNFALVPFWKAGDPAPTVGSRHKAVVVVTPGAPL